MATIASLLASGTVTIHDQQLLIANVASVGYMPTRKDTNYLHKGQHIFKIKGQNPTGGAKEVDTLTVSAPAATKGFVIVTLNGVQYQFTVAAGDTAAAIAGRMAAYTQYDGFTATVAGAVVTFTAKYVGVKTAPAYNVNGTGATGSFVVTTAGTAASSYAGFNVVPVIKSADGTHLVDDDANPVVIQTAQNVKYVQGRNSGTFKDIYHTFEYGEVKNITAGQEARQVLVTFVNFAKQNYGLGVSDFNVADASSIN